MCTHPHPRCRVTSPIKGEVIPDSRLVSSYRACSDEEDGENVAPLYYNEMTHTDLEYCLPP